MNAPTLTSSGASTKSFRSTFFGKMASLKSSFTVSASVCRSPIGPTRLGPMRSCMKAEIFRSAYT